MKHQKSNFSEKKIIKKYFKKLNFNKKGTFNFENDAAYINFKNKNSKLAITTDTILENIDFFKNDDPKSIAQKITTVNLSDLFAMGAKPYSYVLNLSLPSYINSKWLDLFSKHLNKIQNKHNFYLLGGDLSSSKKLIISSTFFGYLGKKIVIHQNKINFNDEILVTGNIGESKIGLEVIKKNLSLDSNLKKYFINKYLYPEPCNFGPIIAKYTSSMKDISDGLIGDLKKMLNSNFGALINLRNIPISLYAKKLINNKKNFKIDYLLNAGDDYGLIIICNKENSKKIVNKAIQNRIKISRIGKIIRKKGIYFDSSVNINYHREFDHFS